MAGGRRFHKEKEKKEKKKKKKKEEKKKENKKEGKKGSMNNFKWSTYTSAVFSNFSISPVALKK